MDNKKLLVLSDTHGSITTLKAVFNWANERIPPNDTIIAAAFLGDGLHDLEPAVKETGFSCNWICVKGNNDYNVREPEAAVFDFANRCFFACHGHRYNLYNGFQTLVAAAANSRAEVVLSGHSHVPYHQIIDGIHLINPGSVGQPRSRIGATFAVIECRDDQPIKVEFWGIGEKRKISQVKI